VDRASTRRDCNQAGTKFDRCDCLVYAQVDLKHIIQDEAGVGDLDTLQRRARANAPCCAWCRRPGHAGDRHRTEGLLSERRVGPARRAGQEEREVLHLLLGAVPSHLDL